MRRGFIGILAFVAPGLAGCSGLGMSGGPPTPAPIAAAPAAPAAPAVPTGAALGGVLGGPVGAALTDADRRAAWEAQVAALDSGKPRSWRGGHGVFGSVEPGAETGAGCRAYSQSIYIAGRPNRGRVLR